MKILFVQLPLLDHGQGYLTGNMDYGPAAMAAYIKQGNERVQVALLPRVLSLFGSDSAIVRYIERLEPDIISFTAYLWNIERSLDLARLVRARLPRCAVFFGGPEIAPGSWALDEQRHDVDCFVSGEGEWFFSRLLMGAAWKDDARAINGNWYLAQSPDELIPARAIVEPFTARYLDPMPDGSIFLELTRGCPYRCSYCYYSRNCPGVRELPFDLLTRALDRGPGEIYILSPTFDRTADFREKLKLLARRNRGVSLHTEMRADRVDAETASLIARAGFTSLEAGLQSMNRAVLEGVRRGSDPEGELRGLVHLHRAGIDLKIGVIPGLPGDSPESFTATIDRLVDVGLGACIEVYPLMVLPGTALREAARDGGVRFLDRPPYYYISGWGFDPAALREIIWYSEAQTGFSHIQRRMPDFSRTAAGTFCRGLEFDGNDRRNWDLDRWRARLDTSVFTLFITLSGPASLRQGFSALRGAMDLNELFNLILYCDELLPDDDLAAMLWQHNPDKLYRRLHYFEPWRDGLNLRLYQVFGDFVSFRRAQEAYACIEPVLRLNSASLVALERSGLSDVFVLVPRGFYASAAAFLSSNYADALELVGFESDDERRAFYERQGQEHFDFPFSFAVRPL
jgi:radical SAM superfamily enzyme YgiQ (UPF0313 family)